MVAIISNSCPDAWSAPMTGWQIAILVVVGILGALLVVPLYLEILVSTNLFIWFQKKIGKKR